jgi:hypothetical protein
MDVLRRISFVQVIVVFPIAVALHVLEEWRRFPRWARRFASARYSDRECVITHALAVGFAAIAVALLRTFPTQPIVSFVFFAIVLDPESSGTHGFTPAPLW